MWTVIIQFLVELGLGILGNLFMILSRRAKEQGLDAASLDYVAQLVDSAAVDPLLSTPQMKFDHVLDAAEKYFAMHAIDISTSVLRAVIELAVGRNKEAGHARSSS